MSPPEGQGELALVLHTHMPYVEGFGTWPFGEEWVFEAMATCYIPLLSVLERAGGAVTLSVTPVLADQLEAEGVAERFVRFVSEVREETYAKDIAGMREGGYDTLATELDRCLEDYRMAHYDFKKIGGDLLGALGRYVSWTSSASHAVLPLLATDSGARLQIETGIASHRRRFGDWRGGFWLPECAHAPWVEPMLREAGARSTCVDLTDVLGRGSPAHLRPLLGDGGVVLFPIDREIIDLVWSDDGYPAHGAYRDYHNHTVHHHRPWNNKGEAYDVGRAGNTALRHARDFVEAVLERVEGGGLCVCAMDTELLGHWWHEGPVWLASVVEEAEAQGLALTSLDDALERHEPMALADTGLPELPVTTWGASRDLTTWSGPRVAEMAWGAREAELRVARAGAAAGPRALRELLALQSSDWAFMVTQELAGPYPRQRAAGHAAALEEALRLGSDADPALRNLAPDLTAQALPEP